MNPLKNNIFFKQNIILKWVHRFGIDSLNDLLTHTQPLRKYQLEEENEEQTTLINEEDKEENQEQIKLELSKICENIEEKKLELNRLETPSSNEKFSKDQDSNNLKEYTKNNKSPLPYIRNLRKWINNDKKAS